MLLYFVWGWLVLSAITTVSMIGKPRRPVTPGLAITLVLILLLAIGAYFVR